VLNKKNPLYKHAEIRLWVAYDHGKPIGRIAGIIHAAHNQFHDERIMFWGFFEAIPSSKVATALFTAVEQWAVEKRMSALRGPMNPSINYECGLQISAFDTQPFIMMPQNPEYYARLVEEQGYSKVKDLQAWLLPMNGLSMDPQKMDRIKWEQQQLKVTIRPANMKNFDQEVALIADIYNDAWSENWGYLPINLDEFRYLVSDVKAILMSNFIYVAEIEGEPCGFAVALPDVNQVLAKIRNGKLSLINIAKLIWYLKIKKTINQGRVVLLGVLKKYQHLPIGGILYCEYLEKIQHTGCVQAEFSWILEDNRTMQSGLKLLNASHYKTYRIYEKQL
jgi:hypothetical protein